MSKLDEVKKFVAVNPGSSWWVEEILFRGRPGKDGGIVSGGHVTFGVEYTAPDGTTTRKVTDPVPISDAPKDVPLAELLGELSLSQQATIEQHVADAAETEKAHAAELADREAKLAEQQAVIDALGGTEMGQQLAKEKRMSELAATKVRIEAELAAMVEPK